MRLNRMRVAVSLAAFATMALAAAPAASAATAAPAALAMAPAISGRSCGAPGVWLKLWGATGEHCYRGNGVMIVRLPRVNRGQILGRHQACFISIPRRQRCVTGPAKFRFTPPLNVYEIILRP
jgi:hypothetical protein